MHCINIKKQDRRVMTLALFALLAAFLCSRAVAAAPVILDIPREVQLTEQTCWAAVSTMALRANKSSGARQLTQHDIIIFRDLGLDEETDFDDPEIQDAIRLQASDCDDDLALCAGMGTPYLFGLRSEKVPVGKALTFGHFRKEIDRKSPVIIEWDYRRVVNPDPDDPRAKHYLIVVGYDDSNPSDLKLRVWNPWPTKAKKDLILSEGGSVEHEFWLPYSKYLNPDGGNRLRARHEGDVYKIRKTPLLAMLLGRYPNLIGLNTLPAPPIHAELRREEALGGR